MRTVPLVAMLLLASVGTGHCRRKIQPAFIAAISRGCQQNSNTAAASFHAPLPLHLSPRKTRGTTVMSSGGNVGGNRGTGGSRNGDTCPSAGTLRNLVLQRAVQTKLYHLNQVRNQPTYEFLQDFKDHQHLKIVRMTDYDFRCYFHGTNGLNLDWQEYLKQLNAIETKEVTVHFTQPGDSDAVREATGTAYQESFGEQPAWAAAAASRRSNPYLDEWAGMPHVEYKETLDAAQTARSLLEIGGQLATEMSYDLHSLSKENDRLRLIHKQQFVLRTQSNSGGGEGG
eukprot:CAMPEP_0179452750 /NCGR_PEP_ID=MMETSP0799-20121207/36596_1 /TAXON_ID=46947 /ORGANISM="Geminigera cryophila, Strain CCMP2564" /LENGTH=284 /DNA_ID=CAMNT_0021248905 /DNA_START=12 /DNA_END=862 /DNA_ORIENTATION=+